MAGLFIREAMEALRRDLVSLFLGPSVEESELASGADCERSLVLGIEPVLLCGGAASGEGTPACCAWRSLLPKAKLPTSDIMRKNYQAPSD
jgi:hypothetical protein